LKLALNLYDCGKEGSSDPQDPPPPVSAPVICSVIIAFILFPQDGYTALHYASKKGHPEVVQILVQSHADVNVKGNVSYESHH
jgi:ankyrin repeat protein